MKKIAVLIPCFNEAGTIADVVADYRDALPDADIYVFDNNSTDETASIARAGGQMSATNGVKGKETSYEQCFEISTLTVILWLMVTTHIRQKMRVLCVI